MKRILILLFILLVVCLYSESTVGEFINIKDSGAVVLTNTGGLEGTPVAGALEYVGNRLYITNVAHQRVIDRTDCVTLETVTVDGDAAAQGTTETTIWTCTQEANSLVAGNVLRFTGIGIASNDASGDILTVRVKVGGVTKATLTNSARTFTDDDLHINGYATQRTIGASGSRAIHIDMRIGEDTAVVAGVAEINTTIDMSITITAQWDTADADNVLTFQQGWMTFKN